jgi:hypothetical protein
MITVHTWTAVFLRHLVNTFFMASFGAWTEPHSGLWACILLPCPTQYLSVYCNGSSFTPSAFAIWVASHWCTSKHHNNPTRHMEHVYLHHINTTIHPFFFLHVFYFHGQAGCARLTLSAAFINTYADKLIHIYIYIYVYLRKTATSFSLLQMKQKMKVYRS